MAVSRRSANISFGSILDIEAGGAIEFPQVARRSRSADDRIFLTHP
jgi:hypothetical protein